MTKFSMVCECGWKVPKVSVKLRPVGAEIYIDSEEPISIHLSVSCPNCSKVYERNINIETEL